MLDTTSRGFTEVLSLCRRRDIRVNWVRFNGIKYAVRYLMDDDLISLSKPIANALEWGAFFMAGRPDLKGWHYQFPDIENYRTVFLVPLDDCGNGECYA